MTTQPEALRLAQHVNDLFVSQWGMNNPMAKDSKIVLDELRRLHLHELVLQDWLDKTDWVQETAQAGELGMHRADVLKKRIDALTESNQELLAALRVAALAIHEYRTQGAPCAYWDDVEYQAAEAIAKAERTTT